MCLLLMVLSASASIAKMTDPPPPPIMSDGYTPDLGDDWDDDGISDGSDIRSIFQTILRWLIQGAF